MQDKYKTKEHLITELTILRERIAEMETREREYNQLSASIRERIKELKCIYSIAQIIDEPNIALDEIYQQVVNVLPRGWQYPEIAHVRIVIGDKGFRSLGYKDTKWKLSSDIIVNGEKRGTVEVCYLEQKPEMNIGPFLNQEWLLLSIIAGRLGRLTERRQADKH